MIRLQLLYNFRLPLCAFSYFQLGKYAVDAKHRKPHPLLHRSEQMAKGWRRPSTKACQYVLKATGLNDLTILKAILPLRAKGWKTPWSGENLQVVQSWRQPRRYQPLLRLMQLIEWRPQYACYSKRLGQCHTKVLYYKVDLQPTRSYRNSNEGQLSNLWKDIKRTFRNQLTFRTVCFHKLWQHVLFR